MEAALIHDAGADFDRPPVMETVVSIQFTPLQRFGSVFAGLFWARVRSAYPKIAEVAPLSAVFETFGGVPRQGQGVEIEMIGAMPMPRYWFLTENEEYLIQLQQDRLLLNWRKQGIEDRVYPRFPEVFAKYQGVVAEFARFLAEENLGTLEPNQCEVTYINLIEYPRNDERPDLSSITTLLADGDGTELSIGDGVAAVRENIRLRTRYIWQRNGKSIGRLHVSFSPRVRVADGRPVFHLEITGRGRPNEATLASAYEFLADARSAVVRTFVGVTRPEMHRIWGRNVI